jgi:hypothetical protein
MIPFTVWNGAIAAFALGISLAVSGAAQTLCLTLGEFRKQVVYPVAFGEKLSLSFAHSIYGSRVEERFKVNHAGFEAFDVRYSERRLVDFYGHESAVREGDWWVVHSPSRKFYRLSVRASSDASVRLTIGTRTILLTDGSAHVALGACPPAASHG